KGVTSACNSPLGRMGSVSWYESNTNSMYLFGGYQYYIPGSGNSRSELWKYEFDSTCTVYPCGTIGIYEINNLNQLNIFPNPTNSLITIKFEFSKAQNIQLNIYNVLGEEIYSSKENYSGGEFSREINLKQFCNGIYFIQLRTADKLFNKKIVKQ
ncbi:MAG: T9SS type A sorting domain-containing protein, partial [Bacteroidota bacterium]